MPQLVPGLGNWATAALVGLSFVTSLITATFSLGGGSLLIAAMTLVMPPVVVVPVHGLVQLGSNAGRAVVMREHIQWNFILWVSLGAIIGSVIGGRFAFLLPDKWFAAIIGLFVLVTTWLPMPKMIARSRTVQFFGGLVVSAVGMVVGAAGPLVAAFVRGIPDRRQLVATHATLNALQHLFKVVVFVAMGFAFRQYLLLIMLMVVAGFAGTAIGSRMLTRVPEHVFRLVFRILLSLVALELIWQAVP
ncbi:MAG TPA: sulfite exporter TauE/SafE family protein [Steroidobacteraceae bacterium]|nr:sulfite exporter TauE/SafE family protein [Steroidobacteraceae bacterium]